MPVGRLGTAVGTLDVQTGDGEVPAGTGRLDGRPSVLVATEPWSPNPDRATWLLNPLGAGLPSMRSGRAFSVLMS